MTLNESKSPGPDDIPPKKLKELAAELAKPLSMLFQASFEAGCLPADWKSARITPLYRSQTVHVGGQQSTEVAVESGVPQGSALGPILFIIYVSDCVNELDCGVAMFAEDIKLWSVIRNADDEQHLQANPNRLQQWSKAWRLPFNEKKCNILRVGRARPPNHMAYCLHGIPLQEVDSQKDLGV
nr:unnamed protein product [Spirometra erinaceieuropaei]